MGCKCGSQIILCNLPVRFDTYRGCSHGCRYCFAQKKNDISHIERDESVDGLRSFIEGKRGNETEWCDWNIPIHWGGMSDPFQPVEKQIRASYECLKLLAETKYPFVVSTKGRLIADPEYLDLLAQCNCVLQISMVCSKYDRLERGTPSYEERLTILKTVSARVQRTIVRIQPYMPEVFHDVMKNIPRIAEAGAYGVIVEGMKFFKAKPGMTKIGGDFCYPLPRLRHDFEAIKAECHRYGLKFYSGENRLRAMGDSMTCCGIDGLPGGTQHFSLMPNDQTNIDSMFAAITLGASEYPYHPDGGKCVMYSAADIITLYSEYKSFVTKQTTYCNALRQWAKRETDPNVIGSIYYGCTLPEDLEKEVEGILSAAQAQIVAIINKLSA